MDELCHITTPAALAAAGDTLRAEPFLHCCTQAQLPFVLERWFAGQSGLLIVWFDPATVLGVIVWEQSVPDLDPFPHLFGALPLRLARVTPHT